MSFFIDETTLLSALCKNLEDSVQDVAQGVINRYGRLYNGDEFVISQKGLFNACLKAYVDKLHGVVKRTIEDCSTLKDNVMKSRLTEKDLTEPKEYYVQYGEIFGKGQRYTVEWITEPVKATLSWVKDAGFASPGIDLNDGDHGYSGWDERRFVYLRYDDTFEANGHCFRIILKDDKEE